MKLKKENNLDDQWITMKGTHVLIDDGGQVSGGPDRIREAVKGKGGYKAKGTTEEKKAPKGKKQYNGHDIGMLRKEYKKMLDEHGGSITNKEYKEFQDKYGLDTVQAQNIKNYWYVGAGAKKAEKEKAERGAKVDYSYGPGEEKNKKPQAVGETSYEGFPTGFMMGGRKYASPDDVKKIRETVSRFMKNAKEGDVYTTGGGIGSAGGIKFKVVRSRGKLGLAWEKDGYYPRPVQMSRQNVEKFISNGAKLVK